MRDLFCSVLTRDQLADIYVDVHQTVRGFPPSASEIRNMGRAALVDQIERLDQEAKSRPELFEIL